MGIITKEVEVKLGNGAIRRYENLGYKIPRVERIFYHENGSVSHKRYSVPRGTAIMVKVEDLPPNSCLYIDTECDLCGRPKRMKYQSYIKCNRDDKIYCRQCAYKLFMTGENNPKWNYDKTDEERQIERKYPEYTLFIKKILARDKYTCQCCNKVCHGDAEVHHLDGYEWCVERRTDETNGVVLCTRCHANFHNIYGFGKNTQIQYEEWIGKSVIKLDEYKGELPVTRKIYCIEEEKIYESAYEFSKDKKCSSSNIYGYCNHTTKLNGIVGYHLLWYDEFLTMSKEDVDEFVSSRPVKNRRKPKRKIVCLNNNRVFDSMNEAAEWCGLSSSSAISTYLKYKRNGCGNNPETGEKLRWMYYEDYLKLNNDNGLEEQVS